MCVTNSSLLLVRLSIPPLACVIGVERGRGSGTVGDRGLSGIGRKGKREGDRNSGEACRKGPQWVFRDPGFPVFESRDSGFFKQNGGEIRPD